MTRHVPVFHHPSEWESSRTAPCQAECDCGWTSEVVKDQTTAEWIHGQHLVMAGVLSAGEVAEDYAAFVARDIDDAGPDHDLSSCACWECDQIRDEEEAERVADGRRDDAVH